MKLFRKISTLFIMAIATTASAGVIIIWPGGGDSIPPVPPPPPPLYEPTSIVSSTSTVECDFDQESGMLEFAFNESVGNVSIVVRRNGGAVVGSTVVNSDEQPWVQMRVPTMSGTYRIQVTSSQFAGHGNYTIF